MPMMKKTLSRILRLLASPDIMFFALPWLMGVLVAGTVAQKYIGLYEAQRRFFYAWILWWGFVPLPGGMAALAAIATALAAKLLQPARWDLRHAGSMIAHSGALVLLLGGLLTFWQSVEGRMTIAEGETVSFMIDDAARELAVYDASGAMIFTAPAEVLTPGAVLPVPGTPLRLSVRAFWPHGAGVKRTAQDEGTLYRGWAEARDIHPLPPPRQPEERHAAIEFRLEGADDGNGIYIAADRLPSFAVAAAGKSYRIGLQRKHIALPFALTLERFEKKLYPGSDIPASYRSDVILHDGVAFWPSTIQMNEPLRYKGYSFYQSSFDAMPGGKAVTILAVVKNAGRIFPYIAGLTVGLGLLLIMIARLSGRKAVALLLAALVMPHNAAAADFDYAEFARIPAQEQGRIMPLSSFARQQLLIFYGDDSLPDMSATAWLAELLMEPERAYDRPVFALPDPRLVDQLGLPQRRPRLYSFRETGAALAASEKIWRELAALPEAELTGGQKALLAAVLKIRLFGLLSRSLSLYFPEFPVTEPPLAEALGVPVGTILTYDDLVRERAQIAAWALQARGSVADKEAAALQRRMEAVARDKDSALFAVLPPLWGNGAWRAPWQAPDKGQEKLRALWKEIPAAWRAGDAARWNGLTAAIRDETLHLAGGGVSPFRLELENIQVQWRPFRAAMIAYALAGFCALLMLSRHEGRWRQAGLALLLLGLAAHGGGLLARMIVMQRPPVTNLYASILFTGFVAVAAGAFHEKRRRDGVGLGAAALAGALLLFIARKYDRDGDTMGLVAAVLDTNFWLSTHVVCMTAGYASCLFGAALAHIDLALRLFRPDERAAASRAAMLRGASYLALFFTATGTVLGGIWADQSWGRFWGWDPKENGALLIVLWLLFLTHGRVGGRLRGAGFSGGMALTAVMVALAWFGVNLLNVGLHSYGFTEGEGAGLALFAILEILFVAAALLRFRLRRQEA